LLLDNFPHIKSYWQMMTAKIAQISLRFGADDMDGTVIEEKIYHDAGATTPQGMRREELERLIRAAGREAHRARYPLPPCNADGDLGYGSGVKKLPGFRPASVEEFRHLRRSGCRAW